MLLRRFYDEKLAQAAWMVGCQRTGEALVIDASRDIDPILEVADAEGLRITHITETHIHADYVSGSRELAHRTGGRLHLSDEGGEGWRYAWAAAEDAILLHDGDEFRVGNIRIQVLHTPGHTPEHLSFLVTDTAGADEPMGIFSGDFLFVGDVGRPDLLEKAAKVEGTMVAGARTLFHSIQRLRDLPDWLQVWPGHGAGSACGKGLGAVPQSTLGYERRFNPGLGFHDEDAFVAWVLEGQPEPPLYFAEMKRINRDGPRVLGGLPHPPHLPDAELDALLTAGVAVVDTRSAEAFAGGHVPGTINIPLNRSFTTWAGWLLPYDQDFVLLADSPAEAAEAARDLAMIGLDRVAGVLGAGAVGAWSARQGKALHTVSSISAAELAELQGTDPSMLLVDVRGAAEWSAGHIPGAHNIPVGLLRARQEELPRETLIVVSCQSGGRSAIAASVLEAAGFRNVVNMREGYLGWLRSGGRVERPEGVAA